MRAALLLVLPSLLLAGAPALSAPTTLASGGGPGGGWVAFEVTSSGAAWDLDLQSCGEYTRRSIGIVGEGDAGGSRATSIVARTGDGTWIAVEGFGESGAYARTPTPSSGCGGSSIGRGGGAGVHRIVAWIAGDFDSWAWQLEAAGTGVTATVAEGDDARLLTSEDFAGLVRARAGEPGAGPLPPRDLRADVALEAASTVEHQLYGSYTVGVVAGANALTVAGPDGPGACPCFFTGPRSGPANVDLSDAPGEPAWGPGTYRFGLTGAGVSTGLTAEAFLTLVDVDRPW